MRVADHERTLPQLSAVTVAQDTALQTRLGVQLARHLAGATTGYQRLDELSMNLHERRLKLYDRLGTGPLRVDLVWPDRSRTVYTMDGNSNRRAGYVTGQSRDPYGNQLPDQSAAQRAGAVSLSGGAVPMVGHRFELPYGIGRFRPEFGCRAAARRLRSAAR